MQMLAAVTQRTLFQFSVRVDDRSNKKNSSLLIRSKIFCRYLHSCLFQSIDYHWSIICIMCSVFHVYIFYALHFLCLPDVVLLFELLVDVSVFIILYECQQDILA